MGDFSDENAKHEDYTIKMTQASPEKPFVENHNFGTDRKCKFDVEDTIKEDEMSEKAETPNSVRIKPFSFSRR